MRASISRASHGMAMRAMLAIIAAATFVMTSCSGPSPKATPPCDKACQDATALRALRETMKLAYNLTVQGKPEGAADFSSPCLRGGSVRVHGTGVSNATQGTTDVKLTYELDRCTYVQKDKEPEEAFSMSFTGTVVQEGALSAAAGSLTALVMKSDAISLSGTVYDPPLPYDEKACPLEVAQNGNRLGGTMCTREVAFTF